MGICLHICSTQQTSEEDKVVLFLTRRDAGFSQAEMSATKYPGQHSSRMPAGALSRHFTGRAGVWEIVRSLPVHPQKHGKEG